MLKAFIGSLPTPLIKYNIFAQYLAEGICTFLFLFPFLFYITKFELGVNFDSEQDKIKLARLLVAHSSIVEQRLMAKLFLVIHTAIKVCYIIGLFIWSVIYLQLFLGAQDGV